VGVNHNGDLQTALKLAEEAKASGAHCVKFQTFKAASVITRNAPKANYQLQVTDPRESQYEMLKKLELSPENFAKIAAHCRDIGIQFLSTPYNRADVDLLESIGVDAFKIASGQIVEYAFLAYVAEKGKPIILSTGMATLSEIDNAISTIRNAGNDQIIVLQCTTNYPSTNEDANIRAMSSIRNAFDVLVGYSDHVPNNYACYAAVALGARVVEKHFTLDKTMPGPDHSSSLSPTEFEQLTNGIRLIESSLGSSIKRPVKEEVRNIAGMRRSITATVDIKKGELISWENVDFKRPGTGLTGNFSELVINKPARVNISADTQITLDMIEW